MLPVIKKRVYPSSLKKINAQRTTKDKKKILKDLPGRKRKNPYAGRIGEKRERHEQRSKINVNVSESKMDAIEEEIVDNDFDACEEFTVPIVFENNNEKANESSKNTNKFQLQSLLKKPKSHEYYNSVDLTNEPDNEGPTIDKPFPCDSIRSTLTFKDLASISKNKMLTDNLINVFKKIMARDFNQQIGLQDTVLEQKMKFKCIPAGNFVQILHDGKYHWVAISTYGCQEGEISYMDSFFNGTIAKRIIEQICSILKCSLPKIKIKVASVQQQKNTVDCGIFAIAFIHTMLTGKQCVSSISFDQVHMRSNILHAILNDKLEAFPVTNEAKPRCAEKAIEIDLYCKIWSKKDLKHPCK